MELNPSKIKKQVEWSEEDQVYVARAPELPGCSSHGDTEEEALSNLTEAIIGYLEAMAEHELEKADGTSKFLLRMPGKMKSILSKIANDRDTSINELLLDYIDKGIRLSMPQKTYKIGGKMVFEKRKGVLHKKQGSPVEQLKRQLAPKRKRA